MKGKGFDEQGLALKHKTIQDEAREKIAEQAYTSYTIATSGTIGLEWCPNWANLLEQHKQEWRFVADQILSLEGENWTLELVEKESELPCSLICPNCNKIFTKIPSDVLKEEGWVKRVIKDGE